MASPIRACFRLIIIAGVHHLYGLGLNRPAVLARVLHAVGDPLLELVVFADGPELGPEVGMLRHRNDSCLSTAWSFRQFTSNISLIRSQTTLLSNRDADEYALLYQPFLEVSGFVDLDIRLDALTEEFPV